MSLATSRRPQAAAPTDGSRTITLLDSQREGHGSHDDEGGSNETPAGVLRLRGGPRNRPRVEWREDVVDNEGMGKKKSKICCIYHKPRAFDESSSEDDSSDSEADSSDNGDRAQPSRRLASRRHRHNHHNDHECDHGSHPQTTRNDESSTAMVHELQTDDDVNAYEMKPSSNLKKGKMKAPSH